MVPDDKKLENFVDKLLSETSLEQPSTGFVDTLMSKINALPQSKETVYKPLISKWAWSGLLLAIVALITYFNAVDTAANSTWVKYIDVTPLFKNPFENLSLEFSKTFTYTMVLLAIMLCIQIPLLKHYFNKRMSY